MVEIDISNFWIVENPDHMSISYQHMPFYIDNLQLWVHFVSSFSLDILSFIFLCQQNQYHTRKPLASRSNKWFLLMKLYPPSICGCHGTWTVVLQFPCERYRILHDHSNLDHLWRLFPERIHTKIILHVLNKVSVLVRVPSHIICLVFMKKRYVFALS